MVRDIPAGISQAPVAAVVDHFDPGSLLCCAEKTCVQVRGVDLGMRRGLRSRLEIRFGFGLSQCGRGSERRGEKERDDGCREN